MISFTDKSQRTALLEKLLEFHAAFKAFDLARQRHANTAYKYDAGKIMDAARVRMYALAAEVDELTHTKNEGRK